jgi:uncharacterized protein (DUF1330 family)
MYYITQLIYLIPGQEAIFDQFEALAIPLIADYGGELCLRLRTDRAEKISGDWETPYEVHFVTFPSEDAFHAFLQDKTRQQFLHLKEAAIRSSILIRGTKF